MQPTTNAICLVLGVNHGGTCSRLINAICLVLGGSRGDFYMACTYYKRSPIPFAWRWISTMEAYAADKLTLRRNRLAIILLNEGLEGNFTLDGLYITRPVYINKNWGWNGFGRRVLAMKAIYGKGKGVSD